MGEVCWEKGEIKVEARRIYAIRTTRMRRRQMQHNIIKPRVKSNLNVVATKIDISNRISRKRKSLKARCRDKLF